MAEHSETLRLLARLRNAIAHESRDSQPIAEPHRGTVEIASRLAELLEHPPGLVDVLKQTAVVSCIDSEPIGPVVERMHVEDFSQVPVVSTSQPVRPLTAETILHCLAANSTTMDPTALVSDVMAYSDGCDAAAFLDAKSTVGDALRVFRAAEANEERFWAIIVTSSGSDFEEPVAIATTADLVQLHRAVSI